MNFEGSPDPIPRQKDVYNVTFSHYYSTIVVGTRIGFTIIRLISDHTFLTDYFKTNPLRSADLLPGTCLMAIVTLRSPTTLLLVNVRTNHKIRSVKLPSNIHSVKLNHSRIVVCLEKYLYIYDTKDIKKLHEIELYYYRNRDGLLALSIKNNSFIAYPWSKDGGSIHIFDAHYLKPKITISAHVSPVTALQFNETGTMIATASKTGTLIRIFSVNDGTKLHEFRRGTYRSANICSLSFSADDQFLLCSSTLETVHIFKLEKTISEQYQESSGLLGSVASTVSLYASSYLHSSVAGILSQEKAFATVKLPIEGIKNSGAIVMIKDQPRILVATAVGFLYIYNFDMDDGGEWCPLLARHRLFDDSKTVASNASNASNSSNPVPVPSRSPKIAGIPDPVDASNRIPVPSLSREEAAFSGRIDARNSSTPFPVLSRSPKEVEFSDPDSE